MLGHRVSAVVNARLNVGERETAKLANANLVIVSVNYLVGVAVCGDLIACFNVRGSLLCFHTYTLPHTVLSVLE